FLLSLALISMEIIWSRIFSAEYFYTFAFLILSVSILGLGLGALSLRMSKWLTNINNYGGLLSITAGLMLIGPPLVLHLQLDFTQLLSNNWMVLKLLATILILGSSFFTGGIILSSIFRKAHEEMPRLYMADLIGAAMGVVLSVLLMNTIGTDKAALMITLPVLISALLYIPRWLKIIPVILLLISFTALPYSSELLTRPKKERAEVIYTHWDAMARLKVFKYDDKNWGLNIDDAANSPIIKFDGNWDRSDSLKIPFSIPATHLTAQFDSCRFLSLGAGAGGDVLQALQDGAAEVHAVEVNPYINKMMTKGFLKEFTGNLYNDTRVRVVSEDARAYVRRFNNHFDVIYSLSSNTFAALASGSFALAENYLFTTEAFQDYYKALSPKGYLLMEHQFYVPRMVSEVLEALEREGIEDPASHLAVYHLPTMRRHLILMGKQPLSKELIHDAVYESSKENYPYYRQLYPAVDSVKNNMINQIVLNGWQQEQAKSATNISPCYDNKPFTAQLGMMKNFSLEKIRTRLLPYEFQGFPLSKVIILVILFIVAILILPLNLLPYFKKGTKLKAAGWLYFFTIGIAFMAVEVVLIQKYTLFIGSSSYTFMTILFVLLASSGVGSLMSPKFKNHIPFLFIAIWLIAEILLFPYITTSLAGLGMIWRIIITCILIAPLGFFMGMPFVKGSAKTGELIDWGFAINGAASVIGSTLVLIPVFNYGFSSGLLLAIVFYMIAYLLLRKPLKTEN
uniref:spermine/spermidine synthase domain-containing protein n=1 Tax=Ancylomarina sp. TaxID=1970196 RepID=UPI003567722C